MQFVRISYPYDRVKEALAKIANESASFVVYEHNDKVENVHIHFLSVGPKISTDTMKNYIRQCVGKVDKTKWSFKTATDMNCITYMTKGTLDPVFQKGFTQEELIEYRGKWVDSKSASKALKTSPKITQYRLAMEVYEECKDSVPSQEGWVSEFKGSQTNHYIETNFKQYARIAIKLHYKYGIAFSPFSLEKVICTAMCQEDSHRETAVEMIMKKYYRGV